MKVSDHLTWLAEAMIDAVVQQAWMQMVARYGQPTHLHDRQGRGFAVVGYGKLGAGSWATVLTLTRCSCMTVRWR